MFNTTKDVIIFDLETTGTDVAKDRIIQMAFKRYRNDKSIHEEKWLINPGVPIPPQASAVHGITDDMVKDAIPFSDCALVVVQLFKGAVIGGYNIRNFDIPLLNEELIRCKLSLPTDIIIVDAFDIYKKKEPHTLANAFRHYMGTDMENAHDALADVQATAAVMERQCLQYGDILDDPQKWQDYIMDGKPMLDYAGKFSRDQDGDYIFTFGKNQDRKCRLELSMLDWMQKQTFYTRDTKEWAKKISSEVLSSIKTGKI